MFVRGLRFLALAATASLSMAAVAQHFEVGDAGSLPSVAQLVSPTETVIVGALQTVGDTDMYRITINNAGAFSATVAGSGNDPLPDSQLFLFRLDGSGIAFNDDRSSTTKLSWLPVGNALYSSLAAGEYLLAINSYWDMPIDSFDPLSHIFNLFPLAGEILGPESGAGPVIGWDGDLWADFDGGYEIRMTGVGPVPEPATIAALGLGAAALLRKRRR